MATTKSTPISKPTFNIKLLAGKNIVMVESGGYESEIFVPYIRNGRIYFVNVIANRRCCAFTNPNSEKAKLMVPITTSTCESTADKLQPITIAKRSRISSGQEQMKSQKGATIPSRLANEVMDNSIECSSKSNSPYRNRSYVIENAKIAEQFRNAVAARRQALTLLFNKRGNSTDFTKTHVSIAENLKKRDILKKRPFAMCPMLSRALYAGNTSKKKDSQETIKNCVVPYSAAPDHILKCANKSPLRKQKEGDNKKVSQVYRQTKRHLLRSRGSSQIRKH